MAEFFGQRGSFIYTITVKDSKVESVLVESAYNSFKKEHSRVELTFDKKVFKEAVKIYCKDNAKYWEELYNAVNTDAEYAQIVLEEYEKFIAPFINSTIHQDLMKKLE